MELLLTDDGIGVLEGESITLLATEFADLSEVLAAGSTLEELRKAPVRNEIAFSDARVLTPLGRRISIWGVGSNYRPQTWTQFVRSGNPTIFMKAPSSLANPGAEIGAPATIADQLDYEGELAVVIGRHMCDVSEEHAWDYVAAITAANDSTARDVMKATDNPTLGKSFPQFSAIGPTLLPLSCVENRDDIAVRSWVNSEPRQDSSTRELVYSVPELLARISRFALLLPGDVVLTGGPKGRGIDSGQYLNVGDVVTISVGTCAPLVNTVGARSGSVSLRELMKEG
ncbi:fumarylacetoacetate hydrolase family protein [Rhodococcus sp. IEGM 1318]|uniref:fumarylacetoacetate hydrolase family protein n=1 Tax=Rhodococcus sp. IEGM 1318 TaxID=3082226 RepID=UPI002955528E|nr:fumarylacetoacetate hydrolase family protein [Rhodococcus sp. IEGM 1318]MDV8009233.1 fumarylacetoacetate hydrolase family protein [Rhodococcus sp. IEGM 1318]